MRNEWRAKGSDSGRTWGDGTALTTGKCACLIRRDTYARAERCRQPLRPLVCLGGKSRVCFMRVLWWLAGRVEKLLAEKLDAGHLRSRATAKLLHLWSLRTKEKSRGYSNRAPKSKACTAKFDAVP
jgi:hypothetical protein